VTARKRLMLAFLAASILLCGAIGLGFVVFVRQLARNEARAETIPVTDGIVALTGGPDRIADAAQLLAQGRGRRLLITGVNEKTSVEELARIAPRLKPMLDCCVDLDRRALNTIGNAFQTARWSHAMGFKSVLVVTSSYHMPRTLAELGQIAPDLTLVPYPVVSSRLDPDAWWHDGQTGRVLMLEYLKWLAVRLRIALDLRPPRADDLKLAQQGLNTR
jgi:uncharacterized SAM-binding protein YcdF (DUF218 family)